MTDTKPSQAIAPARDGQPYLIMSGAALAVMLLVLLEQGLQRWSFLPVLVGLLGMVVRWRLTPLLTLIALAGLLLSGEAIEVRLNGNMGPRSPGRGFALADWLLCGAVLAFCISQYRMQAMQHGSRRLVSSLEIGWLVLALPLWAFLAQLCWRLVPASTRAYALGGQAWQGIVLVWLLGLGVLAVAGVLSYASQRRWRESEARLFLQDVFWQETSREQRRLNSWLAWAGLRRRRKDKP